MTRKAAQFIWHRDPLHLVGHIENLAKDRALELAKKIFSGVVLRSPVYTGSLRASWRASVGAPDLSRTVNTNPDAPLPPPTFPLSNVPMYAKVYISNTTPYVLPIEYGWSKQSPQGMVRVTLASLGVGLSVRG